MGEVIRLSEIAPRVGEPAVPIGQKQHVGLTGERFRVIAMPDDHDVGVTIAIDVTKGQFARVHHSFACQRQRKTREVSVAGVHQNDRIGGNWISWGKGAGDKDDISQAVTIQVCSTSHG